MTSCHSLTSSWSTLTTLEYTYWIGSCVCSEGLCGGVYSSMCVCGPLPTSGASQSGTGTGTDSSGSDVIVSQMVYSELVCLFDDFKLNIPDFCMSLV